MTANDQEDFDMIDRRRFLESASAAGFTVALGSMISASTLAQSESKKKELPKIERPPRLDSDLVRDFVAAAHSDFGKVNEMLEHEPALANATWDWGGGDFESALGGAAHMGHREIALCLLDKGARMDLFAAAMLGRLEIVRSALALDPRALHVPGPHGIPLIAHAKAGGEEAAEVLAFLESLA